MSTPKSGLEPHVVTYGEGKVTVRPRSNGQWSLYWREAGRGRQSTAVKLEDALVKAKAVAKAMAKGQGGRLLTVEDADLVEAVRAAAGERSPFAWLSEIVAAQGQLRGRASLAQAVEYYERAGMLSVSRVEFVTARREFLKRYTKWETLSSMRKILAGFEVQYPGIMVCDLTTRIVDHWIRAGAKAAKTYNNRLGSWCTFLNWCRGEGYWPRGEQHPGELLSKRAEPDRIPAILLPEVATAALTVLQERKRYTVPTFVIGCWLGLRPQSELRMICWEHFDWERGYLHVSYHVARKTMRERYVPLPANVVELLRPYRQEKGKCSGRMHVGVISKTLKEAGVIAEWAQDVMRHSYISYQLALGHGIGQVAEWAGNSERKIRSNYRRPLRREDGEAWFAVGLGEGVKVPGAEEA
jgi:integrase